ncbi:CDP-diacylglycerol--glycerol-3-phosphate 3-phosphatidyltransferase [Spirochaetia bacterium 38H-sp]|uniref:CDP-diacylglycerol--glycerol-3-phosphate 3-phosphatidyltransferase n=1 Tax=Rarispira pelagica TaxID=3141764 RepID=A0ABU9UBS6_9SPIR
MKKHAANILTSSRIVLAPVFFVLFGLAKTRPVFSVLLGLWVLYAVMEISDLFDGMVARRTGNVSDIGKLLDPFADVVARLTYFLAFVVAGILPAWIFLLIMYRELGILFLRMILSRHGFAMGARAGGKLKSVFYSVSTFMGLAVFSWPHIFPALGWLSYLNVAMIVCFSVSIVLAYMSFIDYVRVAVSFFRQEK